ncbi:hypothetical protein CEUSTIGMA_g7771.t1 [Chlamydomonas eustigma]|uniref:Uncharacterized protein n=1 Tax=Chlamydomonas eustigma TaxID=1157962 RepID=A0A250XB63_9CHLO|nr:hypothetical protein CEUSTIGMA_g7771.t1 [Chlamydomonas eustigma]|eukprot:GAX80333.1 hypothetical protein CEUSTIGMA_g7771.t1 [Chlamydomonas eustigma]
MSLHLYFMYKKSMQDLDSSPVEASTSGKTDADTPPNHMYRNPTPDKENLNVDTSTERKREEALQKAWEKLKAALEEAGMSPDSSCWKVDVKERKSGVNKGNFDHYYYGPDNRRHRSQREAVQAVLMSRITEHQPPTAIASEPQEMQPAGGSQSLLHATRKRLYSAPFNPSAWRDSGQHLGAGPSKHSQQSTMVPIRIKVPLHRPTTMHPGLSRKRLVSVRDLYIREKSALDILAEVAQSLHQPSNKEQAVAFLKHGDNVQPQSKKVDPEQQELKPRPPSVKIRIRYGSSATLLSDQPVRPTPAAPVSVETTQAVQHEGTAGLVEERGESEAIFGALCKEEDPANKGITMDSLEGEVGEGYLMMDEVQREEDLRPELSERVEDMRPVVMEDVSSEEAADVTSSERLAALEGQHHTTHQQLISSDNGHMQKDEQSAEGLSVQEVALRLLEQALPGLLATSELILVLRAQGLNGGALDALESSVSRVQAACDILRES